MLARFESLKVHVEREKCVLYNIIFRFTDPNQSANKTSNRRIQCCLQSIERCAIARFCFSQRVHAPHYLTLNFSFLH